jgi:hypothetical protein
LQTYNSDAQIGESSACATALLCGVKANFETVGLDSGGRFENCFSSFSSRVPSLFDWAQQAGKYLYMYKTLRYVSIHGSDVSGLQERNRTYQHKICRATSYTIQSIVAVMQHVCQVTLSTSLHTHQPFVYDTKYCWRHNVQLFQMLIVFTMTHMNKSIKCVGI